MYMYKYSGNTYPVSDITEPEPLVPWQPTGGPYHTHSHTEPGPVYKNLLQ